MSLVYSISDLAALRWLGDEPNKVLRLKADWERVVDNMGPAVHIAEEALKDMLYEQMKQSVELKAEVAHFRRSSTDNTYSFLLKVMQRYIDDHRVEPNRKAQSQSHKGGQSDPSAFANVPKQKGGKKPPHSPTQQKRDDAQGTGQMKS